jgi:hypothetical protein
MLDPHSRTGVAVVTEREEISEEIRKTVDDRTAKEVEVGRIRRQRGAYFWIIMVAYMVLAPAGAILVSRQISVQGTQRSEQKLCTVVITTDDAWRKNPPASPSGKEQAENFHKLRRDLGCAPYKGA